MATRPKPAPKTRSLDYAWVYPRLTYGTRYPTVPHLNGSSFGDGDVVLTAEQTAEVLARPIVAYEKYDGLNVGVSFDRCVPRIHSRVHGVLSVEQLGPGLWPLVDFVFDRFPALLRLLGARYVLFGEWLEDVPSALPYPRRTEAFVGFDLFDRLARRFVEPTESRDRIASAQLFTPKVRFEGRAPSTRALLSRCHTSHWGGPAEGLVLVQGARRFKLVRPEFVKRPVREPPALPKPPLPEVTTTRARLIKTFAPHERDATEVEAERLSMVGALGPTLRGRRGLQLELGVLPGRALRPAPSVAVSAAIGAALSALHRVPTRRALPRLERTPTHSLRRALCSLRDSHRRTAVERTLLPLLGTLERRLPQGAEVVCHGDLKPEHLFVHRGAVRFCDFESSLIGDFAWELGAAFERLELDAPGRVALARAYDHDDTTRFVRAWLHRVAWWVVQAAELSTLSTLSVWQRRSTARAWKQADAWLDALGAAQ